MVRKRNWPPSAPAFSHCTRLWLPRPNLKTAAAAWIYAGGAHHTSFSYAVTAEQLRDFAEMAGIEFLLIDEATRLEEFKEKLRWNDLYYHLSKGL